MFFLTRLVSSLTILSAICLTASAQLNDVPAAFAATAPAYTTSRYITTIKNSNFYSNGCSAGQSHPQNSVWILDFGEPWYQNSTYGTNLVQSNTWVTNSTILSAIEQFMLGFYNCSASNAWGVLSIGVSNFGPDINYYEGRAWASMVDQANNWAFNNGYYSKIGAYGGVDAEINYNGPAATRAFVDGWASVNQDLYYDFGDCAGCPNPGNSWTEADVYYVSWQKTTANAFPEIYAQNGAQATEWHDISLYGYLNNGANSISFSGALTQQEACTTNGPCNGTDNSPSQGWTQLFNAINADGRTAMTPTYSTDMSYAQ